MASKEELLEAIGANLRELNAAAWKDVEDGLRADADARDAARYRWLRGEHGFSSTVRPGWAGAYQALGMNRRPVAEIDAAVDAGMQTDEDSFHGCQ